MKSTIRWVVAPALFLAGCTATAQPWIMWERSYGGSSGDAAVTWAPASDTGYVIVARSASQDGDVSNNYLTNDYWIIRLNLEGEIVTESCFGGSQFDVPNAVRATPDGGCIVAGRSSSVNGSVSGNHGGQDGWVVKFNASNEIEWQRCLGGSNTDSADDIVLHPDGGYVIIGYTSSNNGDVSGNHGNGDMWVVKLDSDGDLVWQKCLGGSGADEGHSIALLEDGGYLAIGRSNSDDGDVSGGHGDYDLWIVRLDPAGELVWQACYGGSYWETNHAIQVLALGDGSFVLASTTGSNNGDVSGHHGGMDGWVTKHDATGALVWQRCLGGSANDQLRSVDECADGSLLISGFSASLNGDVVGNHGNEDAWLVKLNASGELVWQRCFGGTGWDNAGDAAQLPDGGYLMVGHSSTADGDVTSNQGLYDAWIVRLGSELTTGTDTSLPEYASLYPNPTNGSSTVAVAGVKGVVDYWLCDVAGRELRRGKVSASSGIDIVGLSVGAYMLFVAPESGRPAYRLFVN